MKQNYDRNLEQKRTFRLGKKVPICITVCVPAQCNKDDDEGLLRHANRILSRMQMGIAENGWNCS